MDWKVAATTRSPALWNQCDETAGQQRTPTKKETGPVLEVAKRHHPLSLHSVYGNNDARSKYQS